MAESVDGDRCRNDADQHTFTWDEGWEREMCAALGRAAVREWYYYDLECGNIGRLAAGGNVVRISRELMWMEVAGVVAKRSTCMRRAVGAVITVNNRIVATGYNGAPSGEPHCDGVTCVPPGEIGCTRALHAEYNAMERLPPMYERVVRTMYVTESPCVACATMIVSKGGYQNVYYLNEYRVDTGIRHLVKAGVAVYRMTPAGMIMRKSLADKVLMETIDVGV